MTVYVDNAANKYGRMIMCHCVADTEAELHAFMDKLGIKRKWYQDDHYDICNKKKWEALAAGAKSVNQREMVVLRKKMIAACIT